MDGIELKQLKKKTVQPKTKAEPSNLFEFLNRDISLFGSLLPDKKKERFFADLNILLFSGIDIKTSLDLLVEEQEGKKEIAIYTKIRDAVVSGTSLSQSMENTKVFSPYEIYSIQIGEESGRLNDVLKDLNLYYSKKIQQKRQLVSALSYPLLVMMTSFGALFFMLNFVVPMFVEVFKRFKGELPPLTKFIIHASAYVSEYSLLCFGILIAIIIFLVSQKRKTWFRKYSSFILLKIPFFGSIFQRIFLARFCHAMNLLISARTPLVKAFDLVEKMVGFYPIESSIQTLKNDIIKGHSLCQSMSQFSIYNKRMLSLIKVAEEVNQLDGMFEKLAKQYSDEVDYQTGILGSVIEPIMIIFLGMIVGVILIAMYLPLFQLSTSIG